MKNNMNHQHYKRYRFH